VAIDGGDGNDTLVGANTANTWNITDDNAGNLNGNVAFVAVENLTGGADNDTFVFSDGKSISGNIDGRSGTNTLDESAYTSNVMVNLVLNSATGVGGLLTNIQNVLGGNNGPAGSYNILVGNGGNILTGGNGRRNLLIAGARASALIGGNDDDILIGGTTSYDLDTDGARLRAIMDYWAGSGDDYITRYANLISGTGVPLLDATTVTNNGGSNRLQGHNGSATERNLYYGTDPDLGLEAFLDWNPGGEKFVICPP
jgi:hypothetical protein